MTSDWFVLKFLVAVARRFPELTRTEFVAALQDAVAEANAN
jgi:hypothetical protein